MTHERLAIALTVALASSAALAQQAGSPTTNDEPIYGAQMMTPQEQMEFRNQMRNAATAEERERIRNEHHLQMQQRARDQGVTLPENPPTPGRGMGQGSGMGSGAGMGRDMNGGMGGGSGMGGGRR